MRCILYYILHCKHTDSMIFCFVEVECTFELLVDNVAVFFFFLSDCRDSLFEELEVEEDNFRRCGRIGLE